MYLLMLSAPSFASFLAFSHGKVVSDDAKAPGAEIGVPG